MELNTSLKALYELAVQATLSAILALIAGPLAIFLANKLGAIDIPDSESHKKHAAPTPLAGGLVLFIALPILGLAFNLWKAPQIPQILAGAAVVFVFGILDDRYGLSAPQKFTGQLIATFIIISSGISVRMIESFRPPLPLPIIQVIDMGITIFWMVGITNAFNLIDSMDGLVAGLATITAGFFTLVSVASGQTLLAQLSAILFGASISLYLYNKTPARFFLGDSGAQVLGFLLAAMAILYRPHDLPQGSTWFLPILLLGIPIFDTTLVVISRLRRHKHIFQADLAHTYHRLVRLGLCPKDAVRAIQMMTSLLCISAISLMTLKPLVATSLFFGIALLGIGLILFFEIAVKIEDGGVKPMFNPQLSTAVENFAALFSNVQDADLDRPWHWNGHDEGVRFSFFVTNLELRQLAVKLASNQPRPKPVHRILSQYHAAYLDLQAALLGLTPTDADRSPTEQDWPARRALSHIVSADLGFSVTMRYALEAHRAGRWTSITPIPDEAYARLTGLSEPEYDALLNGPYENLLAYYRSLHPNLVAEFSNITNEELEKPAVFWEETHFPIHYRLHRYEAHVRQHTIQIDKTLSAIGLAPTEAQRLIRMLYAALSEVDGTFIGTRQTGDEAIKLAQTIAARTEELAEILK